MRYLISGGTGFVGSHMIDYLLKKEPECTIYIMRRWRSRDENIKHLYGDERVKFVEADLLDRGSLARLIEIASPNKTVFHFAAQSFPETSFIYPIQTLNTNIIGTANFFDELRLARNEGVCDPLIINVSSSEVYGMPLKDEIPITENNSLRAANPYSISKVAQDLLGQYYYQAYGLKIITTRMFSHEGARRGKKFALSSFAHQIVQYEKNLVIREALRVAKRGSSWKLVDDNNEKSIIKVGNLNSIRTYSHIDDAVAAYYLCSIRGKVGEVYNIGGEETCKVGEALERLLNKSFISREQFSIEVDPERIRPTDITLQLCDCTKFKEHTGWKITKTLDDIIEDLLNYWRHYI